MFSVWTVVRERRYTKIHKRYQYKFVTMYQTFCNTSKESYHETSLYINWCIKTLGITSERNGFRCHFDLNLGKSSQNFPSPHVVYWGFFRSRSQIENETSCPVDLSHFSFRTPSLDSQDTRPGTLLVIV